MDLPLQLNASVGHKAYVTCNVSGIPRPVITWFKNGSHMTRSLVREIKGYSMLFFDFVQRNDQGTYWCEANNTEGWNRSSTMNLAGISKLQANFSQLTYFSLLLFVYLIIERAVVVVVVVVFVIVFVLVVLLLLQLPEKVIFKLLSFRVIVVVVFCKFRVNINVTGLNAPDHPAGYEGLKHRSPFRLVTFIAVPNLMPPCVN